MERDVEQMVAGETLAEAIVEFIASNRLIGMDLDKNGEIVAYIWSSASYELLGAFLSEVATMSIAEKEDSDG